VAGCWRVSAHRDRRRSSASPGPPMHNGCLSRRPLVGHHNPAGRAPGFAQSRASGWRCPHDRFHPPAGSWRAIALPQRSPGSRSVVPDGGRSESRRQVRTRRVLEMRSGVASRPRDLFLELDQVAGSRARKMRVWSSRHLPLRRGHDEGHSTDPGDAGNRTRAGVSVRLQCVLLNGQCTSPTDARCRAPDGKSLQVATFRGLSCLGLATRFRLDKAEVARLGPSIAPSGARGSGRAGRVEREWPPCESVGARPERTTGRGCGSRHRQLRRKTEPGGRRPASKRVSPAGSSSSTRSRAVVMKSGDPVPFDATRMRP
jgi:hypothetical protein